MVLDVDSKRVLALKGLITDVDGVLNNAKVFLSEQGEVKGFHIRDGFAVKAALHLGFQVAILSGRASKIVEMRAQELGIQHVYTGRLDKQQAFGELLAKMDLNAHEVAYVGDDIPDLAPLSLCGLSFCPHNAAPEILARAEIHVPVLGGEGVIRWVLQKILEAQGRWSEVLARFEVQA